MNALCFCFGEKAKEEATRASLKEPLLQDESSLKPPAKELVVPPVSSPSAENRGRTVTKITTKEKIPPSILGGGQITTSPSLELFKKKFDVIGEELADALHFFSIDLVGLVAEYYFTGVYTVNEREWMWVKTFEKWGLPGAQVKIYQG